MVAYGGGGVGRVQDDVDERFSIQKRLKRED